MNILLIADIHANFPALQAVEKHFTPWDFDLVINCGDSIVYGPFPNETLAWLKARSVLSILGNTDKKVLKLLHGKQLAKPSDPLKRIMYTWTAEQLLPQWKECLEILPKKKTELLRVLPQSTAEQERLYKIGIYHGSPAKNHEFLFNATPDARFLQLAEESGMDIIVCGHSHDPFHKEFNGQHFINPGSLGRMFDGNPQLSCATLHLDVEHVLVRHHRLNYDIEKTVAALQQASLPQIYCEMYRQGRKTN
ncbi:MAG: metallophosphoesterase family protein [Desulfopila sp.]|jgi:putative phosphoesterase|nr:metallophosphoesterase family protein [Desulfopila sp.]